MQEDHRLTEVAEGDRLTRERDYYRGLVQLAVRDDIEGLLEVALGLLVQVSGARRGYVELFDEEPSKDGPRLSVACGWYDEDVAEIRAALSHGVMAEAIAGGRTLRVASALSDPRFRGRRSVKANSTGAVLCAPVGAPPMGVVYLQDRTAPEPFSEADQGLVEDLARHVARFASKLLAEEKRAAADDPTAPFRAKLKADGVIGRSRALARVLEKLSLAAPLDIGVLLTGPNGAGKTQLARVLHASGPRASGPFKDLNCGALPADLVESELFGSVPGAFTGAVDRQGKIEAADGGTLFLDEIGDLPLASQVKLLSFLDSRQYTRVGSNKTKTADVRIVAATNADLRRLMERKEFRADLFFRINVLEVRVPALTERREDIPMLIAHFAARASAMSNMRSITVGRDALRALTMMDWPGNVRELSHRVLSAAVLAAGEPGGRIEPRHLEIQDPTAAHPLTLEEAVWAFRKQFVGDVLRETDWNVTEAARRLGMSRSNLYNLIAEFGLARAKG